VRAISRDRNAFHVQKRTDQAPSSYICIYDAVPFILPAAHDDHGLFACELSNDSLPRLKMFDVEWK
jgi:hypothetical protein